jgi:hypothetical protein
MHDNAIAFARMIFDEDIQQQEANRTIMADRRKNDSYCRQK